MGRDDIKPDKSSQVVLTLRKRLGMTQQAFAGHIHTSVTTVARWETSNPPPRGDTLLRLADVAWESNHPILSEEFQFLFLDEVMPRLRISGVYRPGPGGSGYMMYRFRDLSEAASGPELLRRYADRLEEDLAALQTESKKAMKNDVTNREWQSREEKK